MTEKFDTSLVYWTGKCKIEAQFVKSTEGAIYASLPV